MGGFRLLERDQIPLHTLSVDGQLAYPAGDMLRVVDFDLERPAAEFSLHFETIPIGRDAGIDSQSVVLRSDSQNPLRGGEVTPGCRAGQPGVAS